MTPFKNKMLDFSNKVILVTGASGILGSHICRSFCNLGARVACVDIEEQSLLKLKANLKNDCKNAQFECWASDVSDPDQIKSTVNEVIEKYSVIDVLINNAASKSDSLEEFFKSVDDYSLQTWRKIMSVNLDGMFLVAQAVGKHMVQVGSGSIVQTASIYGVMGPDQRIYEGSEYLGKEINTPVVYTTSKAGVIGLTRHLATLWGKHNIRVNAICPGGVQSGQNPEFVKKYSARVPLGRMANEVDIVNPIVFLASDMANYITGQVLIADGGLSAW